MISDECQSAITGAVIAVSDLWRQQTAHITQLQETGTSLLNDLRAERASHAKTREELGVWRELALGYRARLKRLDGSWGSPCSA